MSHPRSTTAQLLFSAIAVSDIFRMLTACCPTTLRLYIVSGVSNSGRRPLVDVQSLLSNNMRRGRERLGFSQARVAEECQLSPGYISEIENGQKFPSAIALSKIARVLAMKPAELFLEDEQWNIRERSQTITDFARELKALVSEDIDDLTRRHLLE